MRLELQEGEHELEDWLRLDSSAGASDVLLIAAPQAEVILRPASRRRALQVVEAADEGMLVIAAGTYTLEGLHIRGSSAAPAVNVSGGQLTLRKCTLSENKAGALHLSGGEVLMEDSVLVNNSAFEGKGGAVFAIGGALAVRRCNLTDNEAQEGGAMHLAGDDAHVDVEGSLITRNTAFEHGGAFSLSGGQLLLSAGTLLLGNTLPSVTQTGGALLQYQLPAPPGRWVDSPGGSSQVLDQGVAGDFPFACAPGVFGNATSIEGQSSPSCSGACKAGGYCSGGTVEPTICPEQYFCPVGSSSPTPCPSGKMNNLTGMADEGDCEACAEGFWCSSGKRIACSTGTYNDARGAAHQSACKPCPDNSGTLNRDSQTSEAACVCDAKFFATWNETLTCEPCPVGAGPPRVLLLDAIVTATAGRSRRLTPRPRAG